MPSTCSDCGAVFTDDKTCQSIFDEFLILEFTDPAYGRVHFLTVACFMLQHGRYSDAALTWMKPKLKAYLETDMSIEQIREIANQDTDSESRRWKVLRQPDEPPLPGLDWSMTIKEVADQYTDAASYCDLIKQWGWATLREGKW